MKTTYFQNIECGNIFPCTKEGYEELKAEARELYDWGDPTNDISLAEYYRVIVL